MATRVSNPGRVRRGLKTNLCSACESGLAGGAHKSFDDRCEGCLAKKARGDRVAACPCKQDPSCEQCLQDKSLGIRTGKEPPPTQFSVGNWRKRNATGRLMQVTRRFELEAAARRRAYGT